MRGYRFSIYLCFTIVGVFCLILPNPSRAQLVNGEREFLVGKACPNLTESNFDAHQLVPKRMNSFAVNIFSQKGRRVPYAVQVPSSFAQKALSLAERLSNVIDTTLFPEQIKIYAIGKSLGEQFPGLTVLFCPSLQSRDTMVLLVQDGVFENPTEFEIMLSHELYHYFTYVLERNYPDWFEEGMAILLSQEMGTPINTFAVEKHLEFPWTSLTQIENSEALSPREATLSFYGQAQLFLSYIDSMTDKSLVTFSLNSNTDDPFEILDKYISEVGVSFWSNTIDVFVDFSIAKHVNRMNHYRDNPIEKSRYKLPFVREQSLLSSSHSSTGISPFSSRWVERNDMQNLPSRTKLYLVPIDPRIKPIVPYVFENPSQEIPNGFRLLAIVP